MRLTIEVDDQLLLAALQATGLKDNKEVIESALRTMVRLHLQARIREFSGGLHADFVFDREDANDRGKEPPVPSGVPGFPPPRE